MDQIFEGASWGVQLGVNVNYDSPRAVEIAKHQPANQIQFYDDSGLPGVNSKKREEDEQQSYSYQASHAPHVMTGSISFDTGLPGTSDRVLPTAQSGILDWKERAKQITQQIKKRGVDPTLYGALPENAEVSPEFQWKGYTKMLCSRTLANADPGFSQSVGCPPPEWIGWRVG
jgi:hypothetical protein